MITTGIIIFTVLVSLLAFRNDEALSKLIFNPYIIYRKKDEWFRLITAGFVHADYLHLLVNMYVLWSFGTVVEKDFKYYFDEKGTLAFILLYLTGIVAASASSYFKHRNDPNYNALGASGAVAAVVFSFIFMRPMSQLYLFGGIPVNGVIFGILYLIYSSYMAKRGSDNIGHEAHFWGAMYGLIFTAICKPVLAIQFFEQIMDRF